MSKPTKTKQTKAETEDIVQVSSGNVFADLGLRNPDERLAKAALAQEICAIIQKAGFDQKEAAKRLGVDQPKVSALMRGRLKDFSTERLMKFLTALGRDVLIVVRPPSRGQHAGVHVVAELEPALT